MTSDHLPCWRAIVVEVDGSSSSLDALRVAASLAKSTKARTAENVPAALESDGYFTNPNTHQTRGTDAVRSVVVKGTTTTITVTSNLQASAASLDEPTNSCASNRVTRRWP